MDTTMTGEKYCRIVQARREIEEEQKGTAI